VQQTESGTVYNLLEPVPGGYSFAWNIEYLTGVIKRGGWNCDAADPYMQAWRQKTDGILRAFVVAMDKNRVKRVVAECSGQDFFGFEWAYEGRIGGFGKVKARVCGLTLLTSTERVTMFENGRAHVGPFDPRLHAHYPQGR
jgi:hypothetical protein